LIDGELDSDTIAACFEKLKTATAMQLISNASLAYNAEHLLTFMAEINKLIF